jgi:hypothetical protein
MCRKTKHYCFCCAKDLGYYFEPQMCEKMDHYLTATDGDTLCWQWTIKVVQDLYDCCVACENRLCHYRAINFGAKTCKPKLPKFIQEGKGRAY